MTDAICSTPDCGKKVLARGLCVTHYHRMNRATKDQRPPVGICRGCGGEVPRGTSRVPKHYCSPDCRPRCSVAECGKPEHSKGMCSAHATRAFRYGDPLAPLVRNPNIGACSVDGCEDSSRKRGWCISHYSQWRRYGEVRQFLYRWADEPNCIVCGRPNGEFRSRKVCSAACRQMLSRHGGTPENPCCARCGVEIDLSAVGKTGRRTRSDSKLCTRCKKQTRTEATPGELARRDGPYCQLCGCDVDLEAVHPDPMRPSVDHIVPRALGGSDSAENNQLTHLWCNQVKSDRTDPAAWGLAP